MKIQIINQPIAGKYEEKIFPENKLIKYCSWVKFERADYSEWCGCFSGVVFQCVVLEDTSLVLIGTSEAIYKIDSETKKQIQLLYVDYEIDGIYFKSMEVAPDKKHLIACDVTGSRIFSIDWNLKIKEINPIAQIDSIDFKCWENEYLYFECEEYINWSSILCRLNYKTWQIEFVKKV